ncbi:MAG: GAF domain-containing protein [Telluria sp.]
MRIADLRTDHQTRGIVEEAIALCRSRGANAAAAFLYRFGVSACIIERIIAREECSTATEVEDLEKARPVLISDVLATYQLVLREPRLPGGRQELGSWPPTDQTLRGLLESARRATGADSVGVSLFDESLDNLTWIGIVGDAEKHRGQTIPRRNSMCDVCFQTAQAQLFLHPHRYFEWMTTAGFVVNEALVMPIRGGDQFYFGTLWAITNANSSVQFTAAHLGMLKMHAIIVRAKMANPALD